MAIQAAVRWKPDIYRSSLETTIQDFDPTATPPTGQVVMTAQAVVFDNTVVTGANYKPGDPATERNIVVLYEEPITMELAAFDGLTEAQAKAAWDAALADFLARVTPAGPLLIRTIRAARISPPIVVG